MITTDNKRRPVPSRLHASTGSVWGVRGVSAGPVATDLKGDSGRVQNPITIDWGEGGSVGKGLIPNTISSIKL